MSEQTYLDEDYCEHGQERGYCEEPCADCNHPCADHQDGSCSGTVNGFSTNDSPAVDGECDCEEFKD